MAPLVWIAGLAPVALAAVLPLVPGGRSSLLAWLRGLAIGAALAVVVGALLPEALGEVGPWAFAAFGVGVVLPIALERVLGPVAMAGLAVHQVLDGLQVGVLGASLGPAGALAIAAHGGPLVAAATLGEDRGTGLRRGLVLLVATGAGMVVGALVPASLVGPIEPWAEATVAGMLLHLLGHDLLAVPPRGATERAGDAVGFALGLGVTGVLVGAGEVLPRLPELAAAAAPALSLGVVVGAATEAIGWPAGPKGRGLAALHGALAAHAAAPGSSPRGDGAAGLAARLCAPAVGAEAVLLSVVFLGWQIALLRWLAAVGLAVGAALAFADGPGRIQPSSSGFLPALDRRVVRLAPWVAAGLVAAAAADALVPGTDVRAVAASGLDVPLVAAVAAPARLGAVGLPPLAAELWSAGLPTRAVVAGLLLGPAVSIGVLRAAFEESGVRGVLAVVLVGVGAVAVSLPIDARPPPVWGTPAGLQTVGSVAVGTGLAWSVWRSGSRGWLRAWLGDHDD